MNMEAIFAVTKLLKQKYIQAFTGFEQMTPAIPVHLSTDWLWLCWFQINPWSSE